jgi:hypothetical protein
VGKIQVDLPTPSGTTLVSAVGKADRYTHLGPTVGSVSPTSGPSAGGATLKVKGKELSGATSVRLVIGTSSLTVPVASSMPTTVSATTPSIPVSDFHDN